MSTDRPDARLDMLADLLAGEGNEADVNTVADSPELSAALVELAAAQTAVTADLARLPRPIVPAGLADRITAALEKAGPYEPHARVPVAGGVPLAGSDHGTEDRAGAADGTGSQGTGSHGTGRPPGDVVTLRRKAGAVRNPWPLRATAAVALVTAGGLAIAVLPHGGESSEQQAASTGAAGPASAAAAGLPAVPTNNSGTDYAASPGLLEAALPTLLAGAAGAAQHSSGPSRLAAGSTGANPSGGDGQDFGGSSVPGSAPPAPPVTAPSASPVPAPTAPTAPPVPAVPTGPTAPTGPEAATAPTGPAVPTAALATGSTATPDPVLDRLRRPAALANCLSALSPPGVQLVPAALDYAVWHGKPALVILVATPPTAVTAGYDAFMVGPDCRAGMDDTLHFERIPA